MLRQIFSNINVIFCNFILIVSFVSVSFAANPIITNFTPAKGNVGDNVIINGENFIQNLNDNDVKFNGKKASVTISPSDKQLVVTVPKGAISGPITISNSNGSAESVNAYEVILSDDQITSSGSALGPGDRKELDTFVSGFKMADDSNNVVYYAPPNAILWVDTKEDKDGYVTVHFVCGILSSACDNKKIKYEIPTSGPYTADKIVDLNVEYKIESSKLQQYAVHSRGIDYGLLIVPYKFHLSDQSLTGEATLGGYTGYQLTWPGIALSTVLSAGVGVVDVTKQENGASSNAASLTVAGGFIINLTKSNLFQIGILCGFDWAGKESGYKHEGKPWVAVSFGTKLTN